MSSSPNKSSVCHCFFPSGRNDFELLVLGRSALSPHSNMSRAPMYSGAFYTKRLFNPLYIKDFITPYKPNGALDSETAGLLVDARMPARSLDSGDRPTLYF